MRKAGSEMEKQRLFKMSVLEQDLLVKALCDAQKKSELGMPDLLNKTVQAPNRKLYLNDEEFHWAVQSLNRMRNSYLSAGRSSGGFDRVLMKLMRAKYRRVPAR